MADESPPRTDADAPPGYVDAAVVQLRAEPRARDVGRKPNVLPHNLAAEASILGGILIKNEVLDLLPDLETDDFYDPRHKAVWSAFRNLQAANKPLDLVMVENELERAGKLDAVGGPSFLGELALKVPTADNVVHYAEIVVDKHIARLALLAQSYAMRELYRDDGDPLETVEEIEAELARIRERKLGRSGASEWSSMLSAALRDVRRALSNETPALRPPMFDVDAVDLLTREFNAPAWLVTGLLTRGGVGMVGGEPKTYKTWLALEIAIAVATGTSVCGEFYARAGRAAYFFAEDLDRQVRNRERALLDGGRRLIEPGRLTFCPRGKFIDVTRDEDLAWVVASARLLGKLDLLVLDPLRDISSAAEDKSDEMAPVMKRLRLIGELLGCTVLVVHHAAKATGDTSKRRPGQKLRGSGAIHGSVDSGIYLEDLESDSAGISKNRVTSEVKGARSAGSFGLELAVQDDEGGEAITATWSIDKTSKEDRAQASASKKETDLRREILRVVRTKAEGFESRSAIQKLVGGNKQTVLKVIGQMIGSELAIVGGAIVATEARS